MYRYQQWGAPVLLYRNQAMYKDRDVASATAETVGLQRHDSKWQSLVNVNKAKARWFYPIDQHLYNNKHEELEACTRNKRRKKAETKQKDKDDKQAFDADEDNSSEGGREAEESEDEGGNEAEDNEDERGTERKEEQEDAELELEDYIYKVLEQHAPAFVNQQCGEEEDEEVMDEVMELLRDATSYGNPEFLAEVEKSLCSLLGQKTDPSGSSVAGTAVAASVENEGEEEGEVAETAKQIVQAMAARRRPRHATVLPKPKQERRGRKPALINNQAYQESQSFHLQNKARLRLLLEQGRGILPGKARQQVEIFNKHDMPYLPCKWRWRYASDRTRFPALPLDVEQLPRLQTALAHRLEGADPAYLATPALASLWHATLKEGTRFDRLKDSRTTTNHLAEALEHGNSGNCLDCFACFCPTCATAAPEEKSWFLLHAAGALIHHMVLSHLEWPQPGACRPLAERLPPPRPWPDPDRAAKLEYTQTALILSGRIWQLVHGGSNQQMRRYVARTNTSCVVFEVRFYNHPHPKDSEPPSLCLGSRLYLKEIHCIDFHTQPQESNLFAPRFVAAHPKYGSRFTPSKFAIALASSTRKAENVRGAPQQQCNTIEHVNVSSGQEEEDVLLFRTSRHVIANLQDIRQVEFALHQHPMLLWSIARSYVRPLPHSDGQHYMPALGHGYSLYTIDLRSNQATFQWSPSHQEFMVEGIHSLSGLKLVPRGASDHTLWLASTSARRTWEVDTRMPCRVLHTWTLPHVSDAGDTRRKVSGMCGNGFIFANNANDNETTSLWGVDTTTGAHGLHLYQRRPHQRPRLETDSVECANYYVGNHGDNNNGGMIISSSIFPLPDVGENVYTCGLTSLTVPSTHLAAAAADETESVKPSVRCMITATNHGDLYVHNLMRQQPPFATIQPKKRSTNDMLLGRAHIPVPQQAPDGPNNTTTDGRSLLLKLRNEDPVPSSAILKFQNHDEQRVVHRQSFHNSFSEANTWCPPAMDDDVVPLEPQTEQPLRLQNRPLHVNETGEILQDEDKGGPLQIPSTMVDAATGAMVSALESFHHFENSDQPAEIVSDITANVIAKLREEWDKEEMEESEVDEPDEGATTHGGGNDNDDVIHNNQGGDEDDFYKFFDM